MATAVGVIGTGAISQMVHLPVLTAMREVRVAWVADANDERAARIARAAGVPHVPIAAVADAVRDCEAALLAIPVGARAPYLALLAERGVAVLVEKPFARTIREHDEILGLFPAHRVACGFMRRAYASTFQVRRILEQGWLGRPTRIRISEGGRTTRTGVDHSYFDDPGAAGGGILLELGCHALDLVLYLSGARDYEIVRQAMLLDGHADRRAEAEVLLFPEPGRRGEPIVLEYCFSWLDRQEDRVEFVFPAVRLRFGTFPESPVSIVGDVGEAMALAPFATGATTSNQAFCLEWRWLLEGLASGVPSPVAAGSCRVVTALVEELYRAARGGR